jgi:sigma-B regulation protein RsbU (phosphoserine phosphatase)
VAIRASIPSNPNPENPLHVALRRQLEQRRELLSAAAAQVPEAKIAGLLREVDAALKRFDQGTYGLCEVCHTDVEDERLLADPMVRVCLCEFSPQQREALEKDLELAAQIQSRLLPRQDVRCDGWHVAYHYKPLGVVSGDYCDLIDGVDGQLHFIVGDVAGKGVAASMLMSNLSAIFRALIPQGLSMTELMKRANRIFTESVLPNQYATLVCGRAFSDGRLELASAGHVPALLVAGDEVQEVGSQSMPIGLFAGQEFSAATFVLAPGGSLVLFSDGVSEARCQDEDYGYERIAAAVMQSAGLAPHEVIANCVRDLESFLGSEPAFDDQTLMVVQRRD